MTPPTPDPDYVNSTGQRVPAWFIDATPGARAALAEYLAAAAEAAELSRLDEVAEAEYTARYAASEEGVRAVATRAADRAAGKVMTEQVLLNPDSAARDAASAAGKLAKAARIRLESLLSGAKLDPTSRLAQRRAAAERALTAHDRVYEALAGLTSALADRASAVGFAKLYGSHWPEQELMLDCKAEGLDVDATAARFRERGLVPPRRNGAVADAVRRNGRTDVTRGEALGVLLREVSEIPLVELRELLSGEVPA